MIPHRQEYPLRTTVCPLLADRRQACSPWARAFAWPKFETMHAWAGRTWHREMADYARCAWWSIDHDRGARAALAQAKKFLISQFRCSAPRCCGFVTSCSQLRFFAVVGENDSLSFFFQAVTYRCAPAFGAFFYWFSVWRRRRRSAWSWRSTVASAGCSSSFFSPGTACNSSWRHSPSHAKPCWLVAAIHPESTTNWPETKAIEHAPPFTGHEQGGRDFDFGNCIFS